MTPYRGYAATIRPHAASVLVRGRNSRKLAISKECLSLWLPYELFLYEPEERFPKPLRTRTWPRPPWETEDGF
jgi:hypothetical protein